LTITGVVPSNGTRAIASLSGSVTMTDPNWSAQYFNVWQVGELYMWQYPSGSWETGSQQGVVGTTPGKQYAVSIAYGNGLTGPATTWTAPPLGAPETNRPVITGPVTLLYCSIDTYATDDTGLDHMDYVVNGSVKNTTTWGFELADVVGGVFQPQRVWVSTPNGFSGQTATVHAIIYDVFGNSVSTPDQSITFL
jgi:hypothetical protein